MIEYWDKLTCSECDKPFNKEVEELKCFKCSSRLLRFYKEFERILPEGVSYIGLPGYFKYYVQCAMCKWSTVLNVMPLNPDGKRLYNGAQNVIRHHIGYGPKLQFDFSSIIEDLKTRGKNAWDIQGMYFEHDSKYGIIVTVSLYEHKDHM